MTEGRMRWIALVVLGALLALALRHVASPAGSGAAAPGQDGVAGQLSIPVEIVETGREPRRLEVKVPATVEIPGRVR